MEAEIDEKEEESRPGETFSVAYHDYTSGFARYPDFMSLTGNFYHEKSQMDSGGGRLWRIHDNWYDLTDFIEAHPGGRMWIVSTRGQDITELFESSHLTDVPERLLKKYLVCAASEPRNSPFTFHDDGFYRTLKRRVAEHFLRTGGGTGSTWRSRAVVDAVVAAAVLLTCLAAFTSSSRLAVIAGVVLHVVPTSVHNFIHQRDCWRQRYVGLCYAMSVRDYRCFHVLSHHVFPNTGFDIEVGFSEPVFRFFVERHKSWQHRWVAPLVFHCLPFCLASPALLRWIFLHCFHRFMPQPESLLTFLSPLLLLVVSGGDWWTSFSTWLITQHVAYGCALLVGVSVHHHPDNFHEGDLAPVSQDWGLLQLAATNDRPEFSDYLLLEQGFFGNHALHHLFPTVDASRLNQLKSIFTRTCLEFEVEHRVYGQMEMFYQPCVQMNKVRARPSRAPMIHKQSLLLTGTSH